MIYIIGGIVALIVFAIAAHFINKSYYIKYGFGLFGGGLMMLLVIACIVGAVLLLNVNTLYAAVAGIAGLILLIILISINTKRMGFGAGLGALFLQTLFSVPSLLLILELFSNKGYSSTANSLRNQRRKAEIERQRRNGRY